MLPLTLLIIRERLSDEVGIRGTALNWFRSYLSDRSQRVSVHGVLSRLFDPKAHV